MSPPKGEGRPDRKHLVGTVRSDAMSKTIVVEIDRSTPHSKYGKIVRWERRLYAHDEREEASPGDVVEIASTRPLSRLKRWRLVRIVRRAPQHGLGAVEEMTAVPGALAEPKARKKEAEPAGSATAPPA